MRGQILSDAVADTNDEAHRRSSARPAYAYTPLMNAPFRLRRSEPTTEQHSWRNRQTPCSTRSPERVQEFLRSLLTDDLHGWVLPHI
jgi:hypothetical protein